MISFVLFCESDYSHAFVMAPSTVLGLNNTTNIPTGAYGFWVNKWGHWVAVGFENHATEGHKLVSNYKAHSGEDLLANNRNIYNVLWDHGYLRIIVEHDLIHWEHPSKSYAPTQSQLKFFKELEMTYHLPVVKDKAASVNP